MMDPKVKKKWLSDLRSRKYKQGKDVLHKVDKNNDHRFCCLGVLCDLYIKDGHKDHSWSESLRKSYTEENLKKRIKVFQLYNQSEILPPEVMKWAGLSNPDPIIMGHPDWKDTEIKIFACKSFGLDTDYSII